MTEELAPHRVTGTPRNQGELLRIRKPQSAANSWRPAAKPLR